MTKNLVSDYELNKLIDEVMMEKSKNGLNKTQLASLFNKIFSYMGRFRTVTQQQAEQAMKVIDLNGNGKAEKNQILQAYRRIFNDLDKSEVKERKNLTVQSRIEEGHPKKKLYGQWEKQIEEQTEHSHPKTLFPQQKSRISAQQPDLDLIQLISSVIQNRKLNSRNINDQSMLSRNYLFQTPQKNTTKSLFDQPRTNLSSDERKNPQFNEPTQMTFIQKDPIVRDYPTYYQQPLTRQHPQAYPQQYQYPGSPKYTDNNYVSNGFGGDKRVGNYSIQPQFYSYPYPYSYPYQINSNYEQPVGSKPQQKTRKWKQYKYDVDKSDTCCGKMGC